MVDTAASEWIAQVRLFLQLGRNNYGYWLAGMSGFVNLVRPRGKYDVKIGILADLGETMKIGSKWYEYSTSGNILFGYYSHAAGLSFEEAETGAGYVQRAENVINGCQDGPKCKSLPGTADTFFDSPDDFSAVKFGYDAFDSIGSDGQITPFELTIALDNFAGPYPLNIRPAPGGFIPARFHPTNYYYQW